MTKPNFPHRAICAYLLLMLAALCLLSAIYIAYLNRENATILLFVGFVLALLSTLVLPHSRISSKDIIQILKFWSRNNDT